MTRLSAVLSTFRREDYTYFWVSSVPPGPGLDRVLTDVAGCTKGKLDICIGAGSGGSTVSVMLGGSVQVPGKDLAPGRCGIREGSTSSSSFPSPPSTPTAPSGLPGSLPGEPSAPGGGDPRVPGNRRAVLGSIKA